jgi:hypothetical protein
VTPKPVDWGGSWGEEGLSGRVLALESGMGRHRYRDSKINRHRAATGLNMRNPARLGGIRLSAGSALGGL